MNQSINIPVNLTNKKANIQIPFPSINQCYYNGNAYSYPVASLLNNTQDCIKLPKRKTNKLLNNMIKNQQIVNQCYQNHCFGMQMSHNIKKSRQFFTVDEDERIKQLVKRFGTKNWLEVSLFMKDRSPKQCRDRYVNYLVPGVFQGEWTKDEDEILLKLYNEIGPKWSTIKSHLPNRSTNAIKNRWNYYLYRNKLNEKKQEINIKSGENDENDENNDLLTSNNDISNIEEFKSDDFYFDCETNDNLNSWIDFQDNEWI